MKKVLLVFMLAALLLLCACKSGNGDVSTNDPTMGTTDPVAEATEPVPFASIDWETPIDVDDSFVDDPSESIDMPVDPSDETGPLTTVDPTNPTDPSEDPTEAPTDAPTKNPNVSEPTEPEVIPTKRPGSTGAIELPMIPG